MYKNEGIKQRHASLLLRIYFAVAKADYQYAIYKVFENNRMVTKIDLLTEEARIKQIKMMLSDDSLSSSALEQAKML